MDFYRFIAHFGFIDIAIGTAVGMSFGQLVQTISGDILFPLLSIFLNIDELKRYNLKLFGADIKIGDSIKMLISFIMLLFIISFVFKFFLKDMMLRIESEKKEGVPLITPTKSGPRY